MIYYMVYLLMVIRFITTGFIFTWLVDLKITDLYGYSLLVALYEHLKCQYKCLTH